MDWRGEARTGASGWDEHLLEPAWQLRNRSPELALLLATRLAGQLGADGSRRAALVADAAAVVAAGRLGRGYEHLERAIRCVTEAERAGAQDIEHAVRIELAGCARALNAGQSAALLLHATLGATAPGPAVRAAALAEVARWLARDGGQVELDRTVADADRYYTQDADSTAPAAPARAALRAVLAARHRRQGNPVAAVEACQVGMDLLGTGPDQDGGRAFARLSLELVLALLDLGRRDDALHWASSALDRPLRAPAAAATGWLRYALAMRVYRPEGRVERAKVLLDTASGDARKHRLPALLSSALGALTELHEMTDDSREALGTLRESQAAAAEQRRTAARARRLLTTAYPADADATTRLLALLTDQPGRAHDATLTRATDDDLSSFGLPVPLNGSTHHPTGRPIEPVTPEPTEPADESAESSAGAFDAAWQALLGGTALSRPARRSATFRDTRDDQTATPQAGLDNAGADSGDADRAGDAPAGDADSSLQPRGRGGISELGLVIAEGSGGRRRAPEPAGQEPPEQERSTPERAEQQRPTVQRSEQEPRERQPELPAHPAAGTAAGTPADPDDDRAWLDSIGYWPSRRDKDPVDGVDKDHRNDRHRERDDRHWGDNRRAAGDTAARGEKQDDDQEPPAPIPLRRPGRGRRNTASASDMADLALGELLTEAMMAFHTGATQPESPESGQPETGPGDADGSGEAYPHDAYRDSSHSHGSYPDGSYPGSAYRDGAYRDSTRSGGAHSGSVHSDNGYSDSGYSGGARSDGARSDSARSDSAPSGGAYRDTAAPGSGRWGGGRSEQHDDRGGGSRTSRRARREAAAAYESDSFDPARFDPGPGEPRSRTAGEPSPSEPFFDPLADVGRYPDAPAERPADPYQERSPYDPGTDSDGGGAHAGGTRPGREWRFSDRASDRPKYGN